jgi:hypothetical protein
MKRLIILLLVLPSLCSAIAPERILPKTLVIRPTSWYQDQAKAWKEEANSHRSNADAWFNYYTASLFAQESRESLERIVNAMNEAIPNSYELLVAKGWQGGFKPEVCQLVQKAYAMKPEKPEAYGLLQLFSEFNLDVRSRAMFSESLFNNNQISSSLINYSYNVLMSLEPSSVLITEGESTTTPLYVLQDVMSIRKDVLILNLDMLTDATYLEKKFKNAGLSYSMDGPVNEEGFRSALCSQLPSANGGKKFYYALTIAKENVNSIKEYL